MSTRAASASRVRRAAPPPEQRAALVQLLVGLQPTELHHGDCVGADADAHRLAREHLTTTRIVVHPPDNPVKRASCHGVDVPRTNAANAAIAIADLVNPEQGSLELRRLTNAFGSDAQWSAALTLPTADLADDLTGYIRLFHALATRFHALLGWQHSIITLYWPGGAPGHPTQIILTMVYAFKEDQPYVAHAPTT